MIDGSPLYPPPGPPHQRSRWTLAVIATVVLALVTAVGVVVVRHTSGSGSVPATSVPGITETPGAGPCLDEAAARKVWSEVNARLDALVLHPDVSHIGTVAEGTAADDVRQYIEDNLLAKHLTERERERLDSLQVLQGGCAGQPLTVRTSETLVQDDYLAADGHVDHVDSGVGRTTQLIESYVRSGSTWKVIAIQSLDQPTPTDSGQVV